MHHIIYHMRSALGACSWPLSVGLYNTTHGSEFAAGGRGFQRTWVVSKLFDSVSKLFGQTCPAPAPSDEGRYCALLEWGGVGAPSAYSWPPLALQRHPRFQIRSRGSGCSTNLGFSPPRFLCKPEAHCMKKGRWACGGLYRFV